MRFPVFIATVVTLGIGTPLSAQTAADDLLDLSLEELLDVRLSTASVANLPWTRQPATVSVLTQQDLQALGARDLMGALEHVPGATFGIDVFGSVSLVFRGLWSNEGKALLLIDDMPVNDVLYGNLSLYGRYPVEQIDRIEVIRGAGSAKYGGAAQLAVIRVYTRSPDGISVHASGQGISGTGGRASTTFSAGTTVGDLDMSITGHWSDGAYSGEDWVDTNGDLTNLDAITDLSYRNLAGRLDYRGLHARFFVDDHRSFNPHNFGFTRTGEEVRFSSRELMLSYDWRIGDNLSVRPRYVSHDQRDWFIDRDPAVLPVPLDFFLPAGSDLFSLEAQFGDGDWDVLVGLEYAREHAEAESPGGQADNPEVYFGGEQEVDYDTRAGFVQTEWTGGRWTVSGGLRYSDHSFAGSSTVPRLSIVYSGDDWHMKGHFGRAFREPDIEVINASDHGAGSIRPEETTQYEVSGGWFPTPDVFWSMALFWTEVEDPIIYSSSSQAADANYFYRNLGEVGTSGFETEVRADLAGVRMSGAYSFYRAVGDPIQEIAVPQNDDAHIGAPQHKLTASANVPLGTSGLSLQPSVVWYSETHAYVHTPGAVGLFGNPLDVDRLGRRAFANVLLHYGSGPLEISGGVYDLFDEGQVFPQPYRGESTPFPGAGRRIWGGVGISW